MAEVTTNVARIFAEYSYASDVTILSHFHFSLIHAFTRASADNLARLDAAFPSFGEAFAEWNKDHRAFFRKYGVEPQHYNDS